ncbi:lamin tail domain-containing protein, partial [Patescibacteria group bacterium]|nr:lamin tail domain-containing protein [Patescibacteria group bacterium]
MQYKIIFDCGTKNEWIELKNISDKKIDITGWKISDATKRRYIIENTKIKSGEYVILHRSL